MKLIERYPLWSSASAMQRDLEENWRTMFPRTVSSWNRRASEWHPSIDVAEEDDRFVLQADIPGLPAEEIDITVDDGKLSIKGERKFERKEENEGFRRYERVQGSFERQFSLPDSADPNQISANSKDGVLEIVVLKRPTSQPQRIEVTT